MQLAGAAPAFCSASDCTDWLWDNRWAASSQGPGPSCGAGAAQRQLAVSAAFTAQRDTAGSPFPLVLLDG